MSRTAFVTNKQLLKEIHESKKTYGEYTDPQYSDYHAIVDDLADVPAEFEVGHVVRVMTREDVPDHKVARGQPSIVVFPPFRHYLKTEQGFVLVGKGQWKGDLNTGEWNTDGQITNELAKYMMLMVNRYSAKANWRNYCVDDQTEALTQRGWLGINEITENDTIMSFNGENLKWSSIEYIHRSHYQGKMHKMTMRGMDSFVSVGHKFVTTNGLVKAEYLKASDKLILLGDKLEDDVEQTLPDALVELLGWILTEGCFEYDESGKPKAMTLSQNGGPKADRIRKCLDDLGYEYSELPRTNSKLLTFRIFKKSTSQIFELIPNKNLNMDLILTLTNQQKELLVNTMIDGDGWRTGSEGQHRRYCQKNKEHIDLFQALVIMTGHRSSITFHEDHPSFGKTTDFFSMNLYSKRLNVAKVETIDFHGGFRSNKGHYGKTKDHYLNEPTVDYDGMVWCPKTEYGCFVARRNGTVYLTGNTYLDEMKSIAIMQLLLGVLKFNEAKSDNPFAYLTTAITNAFTRAWNIEKKQQNIRDETLMMAGYTPSSTRTMDHEHKLELKRNSILTSKPEDVESEVISNDEGELDA